MSVLEQTVEKTNKFYTPKEQTQESVNLPLLVAFKSADKAVSESQDPVQAVNLALQSISAHGESKDFAIYFCKKIVPMFRGLATSRKEVQSFLLGYYLKHKEFTS